jgi:hypothetical protein
MFHSTKALLVLSTLLIISCATGPSGKSFDSALGEWKTKTVQSSGRVTSDRMTIIDETKATYGFGEGRIFFYAVDDQGKWEGYWVESDGSNMSCTETKDGSNIWGVVVFQFNDSYSSFSGDWDACGQGKKSSWNGYR